MNNNKTANMGINTIKKVVLVIYKLKSISDKIFATFNSVSGININNVTIHVIIAIVKLK